VTGPILMAFLFAIAGASNGSYTNFKSRDQGRSIACRSPRQPAAHPVSCGERAQRARRSQIAVGPATWHVVGAASSWWRSSR
jgi:hypothetical protein